jgi:hypothetical protein
MPILAPEADIYPANLLAEFLAQDTERVWWAAHTKPQQEKALARQLLAQDVPFYLPLVKRLALVNGRRRESQVPLFASYVFVFSSGHKGNTESRSRLAARLRIRSTSWLLWPYHQVALPAHRQNTVAGLSGRVVPIKSILRDCRSIPLIAPGDKGANSASEVVKVEVPPCLMMWPKPLFVHLCRP